MKAFIRYLNPLAHLGERSYSVFSPFFTTAATTVLLEIYANGILHDPNGVGLLAIFIFIALIIYFAFREGIRGGIIAAVITIIYYGYIIETRHYHGKQLSSGIDTTIVLGIMYLLLASIIGGLKQKIDTLIEREADEKKRLQTIIQQLPVGILITDSKGRLQERNKLVDSLLETKIPIGFEFGKETLADAKINGKSIVPSQAPIVHALSTGKAVVGKEYAYERGSGDTRHLQVSSSPVHNKDGKIIAAVSIITDVTQQKLLEERKDDFVNMASHELKTPITSMKLYIDSLVKRVNQYDDERALKMVTGIKQQTERLQELVNDLLDVSRLQTGKLRFTKEVFEINTLIGETIDGLQGGKKQQKISFSPKNPIPVLADKFRIYQVITNLITNAMKYSPSGTEIKIAVTKIDGKARISVSDQGIGVRKEQQKKIFDRLYQVVGDKEKTFPGLGMGLFISKEIISRHQGKIWVESDLGKGSTFYFTLPVSRKKMI